LAILLSESGDKLGYISVGKNWGKSGNVEDERKYKTERHAKKQQLSNFLMASD
jgi:hypothetical protein